MDLLGLQQATSGFPSVVQKSPLAALCALGPKEGWRRRGARLPSCSLSADTMALGDREGFREQQEDSSRRLCWRSAVAVAAFLACFVYCHQAVSSLLPVITLTVLI